MLAPGTRLSHYSVLRLLGAGGMGEVYEAEDLRLKRRVAIKLLPENIASDAGRLARFEHEAQAIAALNHPNIVTIHSVEEDAGRRFLTMELVEGSTLDRLIPPGGLALPTLLDSAVPLVAAVAAAHARGIVHRDLKPANVMVCGDGRIKVLDFGLAKLDPIGASDDAETRTGSQVGTAAGQILGTPAYMSPEQADGRPVDTRSDVFSLGILLYEMASGRRPFRGESSLSVLSSILRDDPEPLSGVRRDLPPAYREIVTRCLSKDPVQRPSAADIADGLARIGMAPVTPAASRGRLLKTGAAVAAVVIAAVLGAYFLMARATAPMGTPTFTRITYGDALELSPNLSPDGRTVVYTTLAPNGKSHLQLSPTAGGGSTINLTDSESATNDDAPAFSPDGRSIAFASSRDGGDGLFVMGSSGGAVHRLLNRGYDPDWTPDGREIVYSTESGRDPDGREAPAEVWAVEVTTGTRRRVAAADAVDPKVSPDGRFVAFWGLPVDSSGTQFAAANRDIWVQPLAGGARVRVTSEESSDWNPTWSADGRFLYFSSDRSGTMNIWRVAIDPRTGAPDGTAVAVTAPSLYVGSMSSGPDGTLVYASIDYDTWIRGIAFDPQAGTISGGPTDVVTSHRSWLQPDVSPDGRVLTLRSFRAQEDVWVVGVDGSGLRPLTNDAARDRGSRFAPDGSLIFYSSRGGSYDFWTMRADGSGLRQVTHGGAWGLNYPLPSPDGRWVAGSNPNTNEQYLFDPRDWSRPPDRLPAPPVQAQVYLRDWAPDSTRLIAADTAGGLWLFDLQAKSWTPVGRGAYPRWLPDGRRVLAVMGGRIELVDTATRAVSDVYGEPGRYIGSVAIAPGGGRVYFTSAATRSNIWMMRVQGSRSRSPVR